MATRYYMKDKERGYVELRRVPARLVAVSGRELTRPAHFIVVTNGHEVSQAEYEAMKKAGSVIEVRC